MKVLASVRVRSSHGPETDYELLHVDIDGRQAVVVRLIRGEEIFPAEIHVDDLPSFGAEWDRFVKEVQRRRGGAPISIERKPPEVPYIPARKVKKTGAPAPEAPPPPKAPAFPEAHDIIAFQLSTPPTADSVMATVLTQPGHLVVVAPFTSVPKVEEFLASAKTGLVSKPETFLPIVVRRDAHTPSKKLRTDVAAGITRMLGEPKSVLWILPEA